MGSIALVKTTIEISDSLLTRARSFARRDGRTRRALVEEGLRRVLEERPRATAYRLPDRSVGVLGAPDPLAQVTWHEIYGSGR